MEVIRILLLEYGEHNLPEELSPSLPLHCLLPPLLCVNSRAEALTVILHYASKLYLQQWLAVSFNECMSYGPEEDRILITEARHCHDEVESAQHIGSQPETAARWRVCRDRFRGGPASRLASTRTARRSVAATAGPPPPTA